MRTHFFPPITDLDREVPPPASVRVLRGVNIRRRQQLLKLGHKRPAVLDHERERIRMLADGDADTLDCPLNLEALHLLDALRIFFQLLYLGPKLRPAVVDGVKVEQN